MSMRKVQFRLADAYHLLDFSEYILEDIERVPLEELPRTLFIVRKNLRDAMSAINDAEKELDEIVREIDENEEKSVVEVII